MNQIQNTILNQINARELLFAKFKVMLYDDKSIIVKKGTKYLIIKYQGGNDLYTLEHRKYNSRTLKQTVLTEQTHIYFDQLQKEIETFFKFEYVMNQFIKQKEIKMVA
jgi:hypothetical protein